MKGKTELPPGAKGVGDVLSHLCELSDTDLLLNSLLVGGSIAQWYESPLDAWSAWD